MTKQPAPLGTVLREDYERLVETSNIVAARAASLHSQLSEALAEDKLLIEQRDAWKQEATGARNDLAALKAQRDEALAALREMRALLIEAQGLLGWNDAERDVVERISAALSNQEKP